MAGERVSYKELAMKVDTHLEYIKEHLEHIDKHLEDLNGEVAQTCLDIEASKGKISRNDNSIKWQWRAFLFLMTPIIGALVYLAIRS